MKHAQHESFEYLKGLVYKYFLFALKKFIDTLFTFSHFAKKYFSVKFSAAGSFQGGVIQRPLISSEDGNKENMLEEENLISIQQVENDISTLEKKDDLLHEMDRVKIETSVLSRGRNGSFSWLGEERKLYPYIVVSMHSY